MRHVNGPSHSPPEPLWLVTAVHSTCNTSCTTIPVAMLLPGPSSLDRGRGQGRTSFCHKEQSTCVCTMQAACPCISIEPPNPNMTQSNYIPPQRVGNARHGLSPTLPDSQQKLCQTDIAYVRNIYSKFISFSAVIVPDSIVLYLIPGTENGASDRHCELTKWRFCYFPYRNYDHF